MAYKFKEINCNICGNKESVYLGRRIPRAFTLPEYLKTSIVKCKYCGLIYPNPMPFADAKQIQENYSDPQEYFPAAISTERIEFYQTILNQIEAILGYKGRLLDVGCGRGELLYVAKNSGWQAIGIEASSKFAEYARNKFSVQVITGELPQLNIDKESFDVVSLISVLQHVYDPKGLLLSIHKILKKDGLIFIETMNNESIVYKLGDLYYRLRGKNITTHLSPTFPSYQIYGFSYKSINHIFQTTNFKLIKIETKGGISATEKVSLNGIGETVLRCIRTAVMLTSDFIKQGQVLITYARKN